MAFLLKRTKERTMSKRNEYKKHFDLVTTLVLSGLISEVVVGKLVTKDVVEISVDIATMIMAEVDKRETSK